MKRVMRRIAGVIIPIALIALVVIFAGDTDSDSPFALPTGAELIKDHGNGWVEFELEGNRYLFCKKNASSHGFMALTQIHTDCGIDSATEVVSNSE